MMPTTLLNGVRLYWERTGEIGDPLVLVHGSWVDHHTWDPIVPALARTFRVVTYDRRGHSQSERPPGQGSITEDVRDLAALIEHLSLGPAHVLGNSLGGVIALRLAAAQPHLVRSLLVHDPALFRMFREQGSHDSTDDGPPLRAVVDLLAHGEIEAGARSLSKRSSTRGHGSSGQKRSASAGSSTGRRFSTSSATRMRVESIFRLWAPSLHRPC